MATVLAPKRENLKDRLVNFDKQATLSFQGQDPHTISQVCKDSRDAVKKHCVAIRGKRDAPITTKGLVEIQEEKPLSQATMNSFLTIMLLPMHWYVPWQLSNGIRPLNADLFAYLSRFVGYTGPEINDERRCTYKQHKDRELSKLLFVAETTFANGAPPIHFLPLVAETVFANVQKDLGKKLDSFPLFKMLPQELQDKIWTWAGASAKGAPPILLLPQYSPYREHFADAAKYRAGNQVACHHEQPARDNVTEYLDEQICRPPVASRTLLAREQEETDEYEEAVSRRLTAG
ncbi:unnamed protein product [Clonostachys rosea]|uniref:Ndc10 domain-containing protein n=1 Tax=Bionectria ochroleuca TaxID=29856 RepID=A0ABY6UP15_BIOOC|nr:unnamed protein product [Clonostachys rosea]